MRVGVERVIETLLGEITTSTDKSHKKKKKIINQKTKKNMESDRERERERESTLPLLYVARIHSRRHKEDRVLQREKKENPTKVLIFFFLLKTTAQEEEEEEDDAKNGFVLYYKNIEPFGRQKRRGRRGGKQVGSCEVFGEMDFLSSACII